MLEWIIENKELLKFFYTFVIAGICAIIVVKTHRLFNLSLHQGIRYLRNAFLFYGIGFIVRSLLEIKSLPRGLLNILFEFFLIMAGFFLLYSLLWKRFKTSTKSSSLLNPWIIVFYLMALVIALIDNLWATYTLMFFSQILLFSIASIISFKNYIKNGRKHKFLKFYFAAMILSLAAWTLNALAALYFNWSQGIVLNVYIINVIIFLLFLYGVVKVTKK
ncbi:hypothetical protein KAT24_01650 [Candidatus Pacearchaeota archaeon]|nr:hypothetical protein [Candidatus Pacearchaeota archaeon]